MKKLAIIGGGYMAGIYSNNAHEMGIETHAFSQKSGFVDPSLFDYCYDVDILNKELVLEKCQAINVDGVVSTTELTIATAAYTAEKMGLFGIPYDVAVEITNKHRNREMTKSVDGLNHPKYGLINDLESVDRLQFAYPLVIKPTSKGGKRGVVVVPSKEEFESAFQYALNDSGNSLPLIVEEYIEADMECSVESLSYKGQHFIIQVTEKITSGPPHCVELAHHQPASISDFMKEKICKVISDGLNEIGIENGPCHTEIRIKNNEIFLVEFNARPGGDHIAYPLTELSTGYPYIKGAIEIALGEFTVPLFDKTKEKYAGVLFITDQTKQLKSLFDECEKYEWLYEKNDVSNKLQTITHNNGFNINYFIYCSDEKPIF